MESASFAKDVSVNLLRGDKGHINIGVLLDAKTQGFYVPEGQTLKNVLVQNGINPLHVAKAVKRSPEGKHYDVTYVFVAHIGQAGAPTMIPGSCKLRRGRIYCR